jgi:hypothetical protein
MLQNVTYDLGLGRTLFLGSCCGRGGELQVSQEGLCSVESDRCLGCEMVELPRIRCNCGLLCWASRFVNSRKQVRCLIDRKLPASNEVLHGELQGYRSDSFVSVTLQILQFSSNALNCCRGRG